jgi:hypothetical protein
MRPDTKFETYSYIIKNLKTNYKIKLHNLYKRRDKINLYLKKFYN